MQGRSTAISILAALCWLAGGLNVIGALQYFGHLPTLSLAGSSMVADSDVGGWLLAAMAIISLFLAGGLWAAHPWAKRVVLPVAALNILVMIITQFGGSRSWIGIILSIAINGAILVYARSANLRNDLHG